MSGWKRAALRLLFWVYVPLAVLSILVIPLGAVGLVGHDPFMTVLAMVLELPWSVLLPWLIDTSSAFLHVVLLALALTINAGLLRLVSRRRRVEVYDAADEDAQDDETLDDEEVRKH